MQDILTIIVPEIVVRVIGFAIKKTVSLIITHIASKRSEQSKKNKERAIDVTKTYYKQIAWSVAAHMLGNKEAHGILLIEGENGTLNDPFAAHIPLELLPIQRWYLRCEQREEHHTHDDDLQIRPEVSE